MKGRNRYHYLPVDDSAVDWGFYVTTAGRTLDPAGADADLPYGEHPSMYLFDQHSESRESALQASARESGRVLPEFAIVFTNRTHGVFESDETGIVEFKSPTLIFLFPGVWHRYRSILGPQQWLDQRWICYNGTGAYRLLRQGFVTPKTAIRPAARPRQLASAFDQFIDHITANPLENPILLSMHAMKLVALSIESARHPAPEKPGDTIAPPPANDDLVTRTMNLIWTVSHRGMSVDQLCELADVNRRTLERRFRAARGHTLLDEIHLCRCSRARHFLERTDLPVKNICWLVGFTNVEQMRLVFHRITGVTPGEYRTKLQRAKGPPTGS
ncbi:AraC family transcriptional regulator [Luteolibacter flavescens]|uniref:AraC family transcriptional regulator n=1 Tax=Luteolibacter flavescens TaxID=1859460 RepID=A0ABT3FR46_9BACT|nr:AraC family transcriptional regulator [Luteolibacter flavescens]MCW1886061.1 AraC family transcriptional regulator [Luteolibacter flavescens]